MSWLIISVALALVGWVIICFVIGYNIGRGKR